MAENNNSKILNIAMYPWFAIGHISLYLRVANKLAERGHKITYFLPTKTHLKLASLNRHPNHLTFVPITVPPVDGLPREAETTNDVSLSDAPLIMTAMEMTRPAVEAHLTLQKPDIVFFDFAYWIPELGRELGFKTVHYIASYLTGIAAYVKSWPAPDPGQLSSRVFAGQAHEGKVLSTVKGRKFGASGKTLVDVLKISLKECDALGLKSCKEMEGFSVEFVEKTLNKPVLLAGPVIPELPSGKLDEYFDGWLNGFGRASVIYCAFGSECILDVNQFQELVLGLELAGRPFLAALKPPKGHTTIDSALPEGFANRTKGKGIIYGGWIQQQQILHHPSIGCFITHCGVGSLSEAMVSTCQIVLMPHAMEQFMNARLMSLELKIGVEVESRDEDGFNTKEAICKAIELVMDEGSEVGKEVRENHDKWRGIIAKDGFENSYIDSFIKGLQQLLD